METKAAGKANQANPNKTAHTKSVKQTNRPTNAKQEPVINKHKVKQHRSGPKPSGDYHGKPYKKKPFPFKEKARLSVERQASGLCESNFLQFLEQFEEQLLEEIKKQENGTKLSVVLCLERNKINDECISMLVNSLVKFESFIKVDILRLHMNCIHDEGIKQLAELMGIFKVPQLHLSHNYVTWDGFKHLYDMLLASDNYPIIPGVVPVWMRLEYNLIDSARIADLLSVKHKPDSVCLVNERGAGRGKCNIQVCATTVSTKLDPHPIKTKLHLPYIAHQKKSLSTLCSTRKTLTTPIKAGAEIDSAATTKKQQEAAKTRKKLALKSDSDDPLLIVLDTCTIISMSTSKSDTLSFAKLIANKKKNLVADNIQFILLDTVFQQLDERKKETHNATERISIRNFVDDYLTKAANVNLLHYVHPMELEDEVLARGGHIAKQNFRKVNGKFDSDGLILDCALYLMEQSPGNVLVLTDDIPCKSRALLHHLPAETSRNVQQKLGIISEAKVLDRKAFVGACTIQTMQTIVNNQTASPTQRSSLLSELSSATLLVQQLCSLLDQTREYVPDDGVLLRANIVDGINHSQEAITRWASLVDSHQQLKKLSSPYQRPSTAVVSATPVTTTISPLIQSTTSLDVNLDSILVDNCETSGSTLDHLTHQLDELHFASDDLQQKQDDQNTYHNAKETAFDTTSHVEVPLQDDTIISLPTANQ